MPSLTVLAEELLVQAKRLDEILEQNSIPPTSFDKDTLDSLPDDAQKLRSDLLDSCHDLRQLVRGARLSGLDVAFSWIDYLVLRIVWRYKLASAIPVDGSATYREISAASGLDESLVVRVIRAAMAINIFDESEPGKIHHTAMSRLLATDEGYSSIVGLQVEDIGPAGLKLIEAWDKFGNNVDEPDQSAFSLNYSGRSLFNVLSEEPDRARRFDCTMKHHFEDKQFANFNIVKAFDWSILDIPGSRLIDLGGGYGQVSQTLANNTRHLTFTIQDLPHVVEQGRKALPSEFAERISFEAQTFLEPQRPGDYPANAYLISRCLHNWSDTYSSRILRNLIPALRPGSKVLIWDAVLEDKPVKRMSERFNLQQDFIMATISNGKERSLEEFRRLLAISDKRFVVESVQRPEGSQLSLVVVKWTG